MRDPHPGSARHKAHPFQVVMLLSAPGVVKGPLFQIAAEVLQICGADIADIAAEFVALNGTYLFPLEWDHWDNPEKFVNRFNRFNG